MTAGRGAKSARQTEHEGVPNAPRAHSGHKVEAFQENKENVDFIDKKPIILNVYELGDHSEQVS